MAESNRDLLVNAGMLDPDVEMSVEDRMEIERLNRGDLETLIRVWNALPEGFKERNIIEKHALIF